MPKQSPTGMISREPSHDLKSISRQTFELRKTTPAPLATAAGYTAASPYRRTDVWNSMNNGRPCKSSKFTSFLLVGLTCPPQPRRPHHRTTSSCQHMSSERAEPRTGLRFHASDKIGCRLPVAGDECALERSPRPIRRVRRVAMPRRPSAPSLQSTSRTKQSFETLDV